jgi:hypothetical protein
MAFVSRVVTLFAFVAAMVASPGLDASPAHLE